jgi:GDP-mannose pyrophosphatase NudK
VQEKLDGDLADARIMKELEEELGYRITKVQRLFDFYVSPATIIEVVEGVAEGGRFDGCSR